MSANLTGPQLAAIDAMLTGANHNEAAEAAGVTDRTLRRWRQDPLFRTELTRRSSESLDDMSRQLSAAAGEAVAIMRSVQNDDDVAPLTRLRAADLLITHNSKILELNNLLARLDDLEARYGTAKN